MRKFVLASKILKNHRKFLEISQDELANRIDVSRSLYSLFEIGERKPDRTILNKINKFFPLNHLDFIKLLLYFDEFPNDIHEVNNLLDLYNIDNKILLNLIVDLKNTELERAKNFIEAVEHRFENLTDIYCIKANICLLQRDYSRAEQFNQKAINTWNSQASIALANLKHNLGNIYFDQANYLELQRAKTIIEKSDKVFHRKAFLKENELIEITKKIILCYQKAENFFEDALNEESENEYIIQQKARLYYQLSGVSEKIQMKKYMEQAVTLYSKYITSPNLFGDSRKSYAAIFLSLGLAKIGKSEEADRIISSIIHSMPDLALPYYVKSLMFTRKVGQKLKHINV